MGIEIKLLKSREELDPLIQSWQELAEDAIESNPFYESWCLLPALNFLTEKDHPWFIVGFDEKIGEEKKLVLFFPIIKCSIYKHLPMKHFMLWYHLHCFLQTPLVAKGYEQLTISAFFTWLEETDNIPKIMLWRRINGNGPFYCALKEFLLSHEHFFFHEESYQRAKLSHTYSSYEEHVKQFIPKNKVKSCRHRYDHLSELGKISYYQGALCENEIEEWGENFLKIEGSGWKGRSNTALRCHENEKIFFKQLLVNGVKENKIEVSSFMLNNRVIAASLRFINHEEYYGFKTAYDEEYAKYGPGHLLLLETIKQFYSNQKAQWIDSCADKGSSHEYFFSELKTICTVITAVKKLSTQLLPLAYSILK